MAFVEVNICLHTCSYEASLIFTIPANYLTLHSGNNPSEKERLMRCKGELKRPKLEIHEVMKNV